MNIEPAILDSSEINKSLKYFLQTLASYSDTSGKCWPSQETIGKRMGVSARSVRTYLREAVELKLVRVRRRWRKSNIYHILCLVKTHLFSMRKEASGENNSIKNYKNVHSKNVLKIPKSDWKLCYQDAIDVLGEDITHRNRGWLSILIRQAGVDTFLDTLRRVKSEVIYGHASGQTINSPGGLLTWLLRKQGVNI